MSAKKTTRKTVRKTAQKKTAPKRKTARKVTKKKAAPKKGTPVQEMAKWVKKMTFEVGMYKAYTVTVLLSTIRVSSVGDMETTLHTVEVASSTENAALGCAIRKAMAAHPGKVVMNWSVIENRTAEEIMESDAEKGGLEMPTPEENAEIQRGIDSDPDAWEVTDFKDAKRGRPNLS